MAIKRSQLKRTLPGEGMRRGANFHEETGLRSHQIEILPEFRAEVKYRPCYRRFGGERVNKTVVVFLARLIDPDADACLVRRRGLRWHPLIGADPTGNGTIDHVLDRLPRELRAAGETTGLGARAAIMPDCGRQDAEARRGCVPSTADLPNPCIRQVLGTAKSDPGGNLAWRGRRS